MSTASLDHRDPGDNEGASVPGIDFAFSTAKEQINNQASAISNLNTKLAFLIGGTLTAIAAYIKDASGPALLLGPFLLGALMFGVCGYFSRSYARPPHPRGVATDAHLPPGAIKENALPALLDGYDANNRLQQFKGNLFNAGVALGIIVVVLTVLGKLYYL